MICQKQGASARRVHVAFANGDRDEKGFVREQDRTDEAGCLSRGREKRKRRDFKTEVDGAAQSFRDQD
ncbi:hypothetical protein D6B98_03740 [Bradyrhizobium sp. LVM 105]|nr:hypothetical protein D6B98_03740 [Bradyrhizobium sp. LVM 105]